MTGPDEKIITTSEMHNVEILADQHGLSYASMMERAAAGLTKVVHKAALKFNGNTHILGFAGKGNNGGDCLLSLAQIASEGLVASVFCYGRNLQIDPLVLKAQSAGVHVIDAVPVSIQEWFMQNSSQKIILVDGLLGTGFSGELNQDTRQILKSLKECLSNCEYQVIAVDCPSGTNCDTGEVSQETLRADMTVCLAAVKVGLLKSPANAYSGTLEVVDIGLGSVLPGWPDSLVNVITERYSAGLLPVRSANAHKGSFGKVLVTGGSARYLGALSLCLQAAARTGAGLVTGASTNQVIGMIASHLPDSTWIPLQGNVEGQLDHRAAISLSQEFAQYSAMAFGPGMGVSPDTIAFVDQTLSEFYGISQVPIVVDADGLKCLTEIPEWWKRIRGEAILTPHPGEMRRLTGLSEEEIRADRIGTTRKYAVLWQKIVILKGAFSVISSPEGQVWVSPYATSALSHAGSGDVLTGIIAGYLAQKLDALQAAILGVTIHAISAILAYKEIGCEDSVLASDLVRYIPRAIAKLRAQ